MNSLENQLTSAAEEARRQVGHVQARPAAGVRARMGRHRALAGAAVAAGIFGLIGATALVTNANLMTDTDMAADDSPAPAQATTTSTWPVGEAGTVEPVPEEAIAGTDDLVIQTVNVEAFPNVGVCVNPDDGIVSPTHSAAVSDGPAYATPREALAAFLVETDVVFPSPPMTLSASAYVELVTPDGSIGYGYMGGFEDVGFDYSTDFDPEGWGLATLITVSETPDGWTVDGWGASGC